MAISHNYGITDFPIPSPRGVPDGYVIETYKEQYVLVNSSTIGSQTPWTSDINGGGFNLTNVNNISAASFNGGFTTGSVLFASSSGVVTENNPNFFWDDINERFGLGTTSPSYREHIIAKDTVISDPIAFSASLIPESLIPASSGSITTVLYGPMAPTGGFGTANTSSSGFLALGLGTIYSYAIYSYLTIGSPLLSNSSDGFTFTDNVSFPISNGSDNGSAENPALSGYTNNDQVSAVVYGYRNVGGFLYASVNPFSLATINLANNPSGITWSWNAATNNDATAVDGYYIQISDSTTSTVYSYDVGNVLGYDDQNIGGTVTINSTGIPFGIDLSWSTATTGSYAPVSGYVVSNSTTGYSYDTSSATNFTDTNTSNTVSYAPFLGLVAANQTIIWTPYGKGTSPSSNAYFIAGTPYFYIDPYNNGSLFQLTHTISASGDWRIYEDVSTATFDGTGSTSFTEVTAFTGPNVTTPISYGIISNGSALNLDFEFYSYNGALYSSGFLASTPITDPNDGMPYYVQFNYNTSTSQGKILRSINGAGFGTGQLVTGASQGYDVLGPAFTDGTGVAPNITSNPGSIIQGTSSSISIPVQIIESTTSSTGIAGTEYRVDGVTAGRIWGDSGPALNLKGGGAASIEIVNTIILTGETDINGGRLYVDLFQQFGIIAAGSVANDSVFINSSNSKLSFKDSGGTTHPLYGVLAIGDTITGGTAGSLLFVNPTATIAQDNAHLFWDETNKRMAIGTNVPLTTNAFEINGSQSIMDRVNLGAEILTNGSFTGSASPWNLPTGWAYSSNTVVKNADGSGGLTQYQLGAQTGFAQGQLCALTFTISSLTVGSVTPSVGSVAGTTVSANGTYTQYFLPSNGFGPTTFAPTNTSRFTIDNVSLKQLTGNLSVGGTISSNGNLANSSISGAYFRGNQSIWNTANAGILQISTTAASSGNESNSLRGIIFGIDSSTLATAGTGFMQYWSGAGDPAGLVINPNGGAVTIGSMQNDPNMSLIVGKNGNSYLKIQNTSSFGGSGSPYTGVLFQQAGIGYTTYQKAAIIYDAYDGTGGGFGRGRILFCLDNVLDGSSITDNIPAYTVANIDYNALNFTIGQGVTAGVGKLNVLSTTEQFRAYYDTSNYFSTTVGSTGSTTFALTGTSPLFTFSQGIINSALTASKLVLTDGSKKLISGTIANQVAAGLTTVVTSVSLTNQGADIGSTNFSNTSTAGLYRIHYSLEDTTSDITAGAVTLTIAYTADAGAITIPSAAQVLTGTGLTQGTIFVQLASGSISYSTTHTGLIGTAKYALYLTVERLL